MRLDGGEVGTWVCVLSHVWDRRSRFWRSKMLGCKKRTWENIEVRGVWVVGCVLMGENRRGQKNNANK